MKCKEESLDIKLTENFLVLINHFPKLVPVTRLHGTSMELGLTIAMELAQKVGI